MEGARTHHLHVCRVGHFQIRELIWFAQYLRENAEVAVEYTRLKTQAAAVNGHDNVQYMVWKEDSRDHRLPPIPIRKMRCGGVGS